MGHEMMGIEITFAIGIENMKKHANISKHSINFS
jgi:hypothetical protein